VLVADCGGRTDGNDGVMAETRYAKSFGGLRVLVAGGGVAGLEALVALRALAGDLVDLELLAPEPRFWYRPLAVAEPFQPGGVHYLELAAVADAVAAGFTLDRLASVDADTRTARTGNGSTIQYDELVIACGTVPRRPFEGALTFRGPADRDAFAALLGELERGVVRSVAFVVPGAAVWPLPIYELALLTATRLKQCAVDVEVALVTPESAPLALFGAAASEAVGAVLADRGITLHTSCDASRYDGDRLELVTGSSLPAERVVALPHLEGSQILGIPQDADGFIATDSSGRVEGLSRVYAAGDITQFPIKQGGIGAQQADALAELIAARAGAPVIPERFRPVLRSLLLTGGAPLYLRSEPTRGHGDAGTVSTEPLWWPPAKIAGRYLAPFLAGSFDQLAHART
jgi:sulfide:quinone oxidoreductase